MSYQLSCFSQLQILISNFTNLDKLCLTWQTYQDVQMAPSIQHVHNNSLSSLSSICSLLVLLYVWTLVIISKSSCLLFLCFTSSKHATSMVAKTFSLLYLSTVWCVFYSFPLYCLNLPEVRNSTFCLIQWLKILCVNNFRQDLYTLQRLQIPQFSQILHTKEFTNFASRNLSLWLLGQTLSHLDWASAAPP